MKKQKSKDNAIQVAMFALAVLSLAALIVLHGYMDAERDYNQLQTAKQRINDNKAKMLSELQYDFLASASLDKDVKDLSNEEILQIKRLWVYYRMYEIDLNNAQAG